MKGLAVAAIAVSLVACGKKEKPGIDFSLKDSTGETVKLSNYRGKVVLLNFWATWCGPCKIEIPWFMEFQRQYKDRNFAVLGVSMDEDGWESVRPYLAQNKINYRIMVGNDDTGKLFGGVDDLPTTFVLDRGGHIATKHVGLVSKSLYEQEISKLLANQKLVGEIAVPHPSVFAFFRMP